MNVNLNNDQQPPPVTFDVCGSMASLPDSQTERTTARVCICNGGQAWEADFVAIYGTLAFLADLSVSTIFFDASKTM